jgi:hypothetical protein
MKRARLRGTDEECSGLAAEGDSFRIGVGSPGIRLHSILST